MGIAAHEIGEIVGKALYAEMTKRGVEKGGDRRLRGDL